MTLRQTVPTTGVGGMVQWSRAFGGAHYFTAGTDWRWVDGDSEELGLDAVTGTQVTLERISGGTQRSVGVFVQDLIAPLPDLTITLSARVDNWRNYDGHNLEHTVPSGTPTAGHNPALPDSQRHGRQPPRGRALSRHGPHRRLGRHGLGIPRPDVERAVSSVPRRHDADPREQRARARSVSSAARPG